MLDELVRLVVGALAIWRISVALWYENGPFDIYTSIRKYIEIRGMPKAVYKEGSEVDLERCLIHNYFWEYIWEQSKCFWCVTFWVSLPISLLIIFPWHQWVILIPFALSGIAILLGGAGRTIWRAGND